MTMQRLYEIKTVKVHGEITIPQDHTHYWVLTPREEAFFHSNPQAFRVVLPTPIGIIDPELRSEPVALFVATGQYYLLYWDVPFKIDVFVPTDEFADPDQTIEENLNADGLYFANWKRSDDENDKE